MFNIQDYREIAKQRYLEKCKKTKLENELKLLKEIGFTYDISNLIIKNNCINKIQLFFKKYRISDKQVCNLEDIINYSKENIIKFRHKNQIFGFHFMNIKKHFDLNGFTNPKDNNIIDIKLIQRINKKVKLLDNYNYSKKSSFINVESFYFKSFEDNWDACDIYQLFESRGKNIISAPKELYDKMLELPPDVYGIEILSNENNNFNRSYVSFDNEPSEDFVNFPLNVYNQLNSKPNKLDYKLRIIRPPKAEKIWLRCMLNDDKLLKDIKKTLTLEINVHKILSKNQIIIVESDVNYNMIPFIVEKCEPSDVVNINDVDVQIDFLPSLEYTDPIVALLIHLNEIF